MQGEKPAASHLRANAPASTLVNQYLLCQRESRTNRLTVERLWPVTEWTEAFLLFTSNPQGGILARVRTLSFDGALTNAFWHQSELLAMEKRKRFIDETGAKGCLDTADCTPRCFSIASTCIYKHMYELTAGPSLVHPASQCHKETYHAIRFGTSATPHLISV